MTMTCPSLFPGEEILSNHLGKLAVVEGEKSSALCLAFRKVRLKFREQSRPDDHGEALFRRFVMSTLHEVLEDFLVRR
jgi:hypothetical protein